MRFRRKSWKWFRGSNIQDVYKRQEPCHKETYDNEEAIKKMVLSQGFQIKDGELQKPENGEIKLTVPTGLIPYCPHCGKPMSMNLRSDQTFVEDDGWHQAAERYEKFIQEHKKQKIVFLELGVGYNTPGIIKYPFWQMKMCIRDRGEDTHYSFTEKAIREGKHVLLEKPICLNVEDGKKLLELEQNTDLYILPGHILRLSLIHI